MLSTTSRRCLLGIPVSGIGLALAASSVAWACTVRVGSVPVLTPNSGARGSAFTISATGMDNNTTYAVAWLDSASGAVDTACHHSLEIVGTGQSDGKGNATGNGTVPRTAVDGMAKVCFSRDHLGSYSQDATFTVLGGLVPVG